MARAFTIPFPLKGVDAGFAYGRQPPETTPAAVNVRGYSADAERARGGQRPGIKRAYPTRVGGTTAAPVAFLGWLDTGFGDTEVYVDEFDYAAGTLAGCTASGVTTWKDAAAPLTALNGYVALSGPAASQSAGNYQNFASDTWDDFVFESAIAWNYGTSGQIVFWINSAGAGPTDGARITFDLTATWIVPPGLGFTQAYAITLESEGGGATTTARWHGYDPNLVVRIGGVIRVEASKDTVRLFWNGNEVASVARPAPAAPCAGAGFSMAMSSPSGSPLPDSMLSLRVLDWRVTATTRPTEVIRKAVAVAGQDLWYETSGGTGFTATSLANAFPAVGVVGGAHCNGQMFFVTGSTCLRYNATSNLVYSWQATKGKLERDCTILANWRNRLVMAGSVQHPQVLYMSRVDDPRDWDYARDDPESATYSAQFDMGRIGDPVKALCPLSNDVLIVGASRSIWAIEGDPMAGGRITRRADNIGMLTQTAWCTDQQGNLYWLWNEGLYAMTPFGTPKALTTRRIPGLGSVSAIEAGTTGTAGKHYVSLVHDADRHGILILQTPHEGTAGSHYFFDLRNNAFWPETYPAAVGPMCGAYYNATDDDRKRIILGGRTGCLYAFDDARKYDEVGITATTGATGTTACNTEAGGTAGIGSSVIIGPMAFGGPGGRAVVTRIIATHSSKSDGTQWVWKAEDAAEALGGAEARATMVMSAGRNISRARVRGDYHAVTIQKPPGSADRSWAFEDMVVEVEPGGPRR